MAASVSPAPRLPSYVASSDFIESGKQRGGFDWVLALLVVVISLWGVASVFSATRGEAAAAGDGAKQAGFVVLGLMAMGAIAMARYRSFVHVQAPLYIATLITLAVVLKLPTSIAPVINGAKSWIRLGPISLQISEFAKFALLVCLAAFWARRQKEAQNGRTLFLSFLYVLPPLLLVLKQPDFGTAVAILSIWLGVAFFAGARATHLLLAIFIGVALFTVVWNSGKLAPHQKERLAVFLTPDTNLRGSGYQLNQAQIAIGGGQITGQGFGQGLQNRAHYVPENHTDFVFTVVAEEWGFVGGSLLLLLYLALLWRTARLAGEGDSYFGTLLCGGFSALLAFHCLINIGMTMRLMPVTGVPLPFFSYGGSSFLAFSLGAGTCLSVSARRR
ncbi:peptidoglycan glycosyltransferase MrdB [Abditibacteriota bacterium]|nr:peptidoglycan glycosyltransferase MrdB [Abditibacteriota bacterium]